MKKVLVAMSGGVDSSAAVSLLQQQGYAVAGATMKLFDTADTAVSAKACCTAEDAEDAKTVCRKAGVDHFMFNFKREFREKVIDKFITTYAAGGTPNPCIDCNRYLKFDKFLRRADELGYDFIATGHYAIIERDGNSFRLKKSTDRTKDQSYVLYFLTQTQLSRLLLPLGGMTKNTVKEEAGARYGLYKRESQDICFVPAGNYADLIRNAVGVKTGDIVRDGVVVGRHNGAFAYTVGQRRGLSVSAEIPLYVHGKDADTVYVGEEQLLYRRKIIIDDVNIITPEFMRMPLSVRTRYNAAETPATVTAVGGGRYEAVFDTPVRAAAAGQAAVFYCGDYVAGGGTICPSASVPLWGQLLPDPYRG